MKVKLQVPAALVMRMGVACAFATVGLSVYWGHVYREMGLGRVSSAVGIGIGRTKSLDPPLAVHSMENISLYPSAPRSGGCLRCDVALSIAEVVFWPVLRLV